MGSSLVLNRRPKVPAEDTAAFGAIAERFRRAGALEQAVSLCRDGLKKFPDHVSARVTLGWSLLDLGKYDEARVELEQVMRRAPDNLAAIRGLAELHDRFEHTLNLPMDGPGQWPPPADSMDAEVSADDASIIQVAGATLEARDATASGQFVAEVPAQPEPALAEPAMAPAAMGLPLWTPEPAPSPVAEAAVEPIATAGAGMSSVREIDAFAGAPVPDVAAQVVAAPESTAQQTQPDLQTPDQDEAQFEMEAPVVAIAAHVGVTDSEEEGIDLGLTPLVTGDKSGATAGVTSSISEDAIAALIAEAESLDAAAELEVVAAPDALELGSVEVELDSAAPIEAVELEPAASMDLELAIPEPIVESSVESAFEPALASAVEPALASAIEPALASAIEIESIPASEVLPEVAEAAEVAFEATEVAPVVAEVALEVAEVALEVAEVTPEVAEVDAEVAEVIAFAPRPAAVAESVELEPAELLQDEQEEAVAQVIAMPSQSAATAAQVVALERMLRRVQARRSQLMTESVA